MCDRNTWLLIKRANILSDLIASITAEEINPTSTSYEDKIKLYDPYGDKDFDDTVRALTESDKRWTDKLPWNHDEPAYRKGRLQKTKAKEFIEDYTKRVRDVQKYWQDQLCDYTSKWMTDHNDSAEGLDKDNIYNKLIKATKKFTPTEFFKDFKVLKPKAKQEHEKGILGTLFQLKWLKEVIKNKLMVGSLGFK